MDNQLMQEDPFNKVWIWSSFRRELIKQSIYFRQDGRPASPSASSSTSRRHSSASTPAVAPMPRKDEVVIRRAVEAEFGRVDPDEWVLTPNDPIEWRECLKVALHLTPERSLSALLLSVLKLPLVQLLLRNLVQYFGVLFDLCDEVCRIEPPAVANEKLLRKRWTLKLEGALNPVSASYMRLLTGEQLEKKHHMERGRSLHSCKERDEKIWEGIYEVAELLVWLVFRRRDRELLQIEFARLFRGPLGESIRSPFDLNPLSFNTGGVVSGERTISTTNDVDENYVLRMKEMNVQMKRRKKHISKNLRATSGLISRKVPDLSTAQLVKDSYDNMAVLTYVAKKDGSTVWGDRLGLLGARKGDLNELLEPAVTDEDEIDMMDD